MDTPTPPRLLVRMLGGFTLSGADGEELTLPRKKMRALVALLAMAPAAGWPRERLTALLWGDRDEEQARGSRMQVRMQNAEALTTQQINEFLKGSESIEPWRRWTLGCGGMASEAGCASIATTRCPIAPRMSDIKWISGLKPAPASQM